MAESEKRQRRILEAKEKVISLMKNRGTEAAMKFFHKHFNRELPPDVGFLKRFYEELSKVKAYEEAFILLNDTAKFIEKTSDFNDLLDDSRKIYHDHLLARGNQALTERDEKAATFAEGLRRTDSLSRDKVRVENEKILLNICKKGLEFFKKALTLNNESIGALTGLHRCYKILEDEEKLKEVNEILEERNPHQIAKKTDARDAHIEFEYKEFDIEEFHIKEVETLYYKKKYAKVIKKVDQLHMSHKISVPLMILKIESLVALKKFKEADRAYEEADRQNTHLKELHELANQVKEIKFKLLTKALDVYLRKGLELGKSLGEKHFKKARKCVRRALDIYPDNVELLDKLYTIYQYLGQTEEAFKVKARIYTLNSKFITAFDKESNTSLCFLATFAYDNNPAKLDIFRWFRREFLLTSKLGQKINSSYVKFSPKLLEKIQYNKYAKPIFLLLLEPLRLFFILIKKTGIIS